MLFNISLQYMNECVCEKTQFYTFNALKDKQKVKIQIVNNLFWFKVTFETTFYLKRKQTTLLKWHL